MSMRQLFANSMLGRLSQSVVAFAFVAGCSGGLSESRDTDDVEQVETSNAEFSLAEEAVQKGKNRQRFRCRADGDGGREADLRLRIRGGDTEFRAKWEINKGEGQVVGTVVNVSIDGVFIGGIVLEDDGDQLEGDIEFEDDEFPGEFPEIEEGTPVSIGALFCEFEND